MIDESLYKFQSFRSNTISVIFLEVKNMDACIRPLFTNMVTIFANPSHQLSMFKADINTSYSRWEGWITLSDLAATEAQQTQSIP